MLFNNGGNYECAAVPLQGANAVSGTLQIVNGGTGLTTSGAIYDSLISNGSAWVNYPTWVNNGNAFSGNGTLGTSDANDMRFIAGGNFFEVYSYSANTLSLYTANTIAAQFSNSQAFELYGGQLNFVASATIQALGGAITIVSATGAAGLYSSGSGAATLEASGTGNANVNAAGGGYAQLIAGGSGVAASAAGGISIQSASGTGVSIVSQGSGTVNIGPAGSGNMALSSGSGSVALTSGSGDTTVGPTAGGNLKLQNGNAVSGSGCSVTKTWTLEINGSSHTIALCN
jgi:hypothetical protein